MSKVKDRIYSTVNAAANATRNAVKDSETANALRNQASLVGDATKSAINDVGKSVDKTMATGVNEVGATIRDFTGDTSATLQTKTTSGIQAVGQKAIYGINQANIRTQAEINKIGGRRRKAAKKGSGDPSAVTQEWEENPASKIYPPSKMGGKAKSHKPRRSRSKSKSRSQSKGKSHKK